MTGWPLERCVFVDDRPANLDAAAALGMATVWWVEGPAEALAEGRAVVESFEALGWLLGR